MTTATVRTTATTTAAALTDSGMKELVRLLWALRRAKGTENKLTAAADLLAHTGMIHDTPASKDRWRSDKD